MSLADLTSAVTAATGLSNLIVAVPQSTVGYQPQLKGGTTAVGKALVFHYEGEQAVALRSEITDHYVEDNTTIQDQISLRPVTITTHGFIGDLNNVAPAALQALQTIADKLTVISAYTPALSATALIAYNEAAFAYQLAVNAASSAVSAYSTIAGGATGEAVVANDTISNTQLKSQGPQQIMFQQFYGYYSTRTLFTVQTPWAIFQNMAIESFRSVQDGDTNVITDFEVTFKQMRFASTEIVASDAVQGQLNSQSATTVYDQQSATTSDTAYLLPGAA